MKPRFISEDQFREMEKTVSKNRVRGSLPGRMKSGAVIQRSTVPTKVSVPSPLAPYRSKLEKSWAGYLDGMKALGVIDGWHYEPANFRLPGTKNFYREDFIVWKGRSVTFYQVKGRNKSDDASLVKLKTAAAMHPWATWIQVKRENGQWEERVMT
jgi:hypothetical protein